MKESSNLDFYGYITLFFNNIDFVIFDTSSYALNILPIYSDTTLNGKHLIADKLDGKNVRIIKFPDPHINYQPGLATTIPTLINPGVANVKYDHSAKMWKVKFQNSGPLG